MFQSLLFGNDDSENDTKCKNIRQTGINNNDKKINLN